jgi:hypothetical protein
MFSLRPTEARLCIAVMIEVMLPVGGPSVKKKSLMRLRNAQVEASQNQGTAGQLLIVPLRQPICYACAPLNKPLSVSAERIRLFVALAPASLPGMLGEKPDGGDHLRP